MRARPAFRLVGRLACPVVGVDPGERTGVALLVPTTLAHWHEAVRAWNLASPDGRRSGLLLDEVMAEVRGHGYEMPPVLAVEDAGIVHGSRAMADRGAVCAACTVMARATRALAERVGQWRAVAEERDWSVVTFPARSWQARFLGRQRVHVEAAKLTIARAKKTWPSCNWTDDSAAAAHVALYAAEGLAAARAGA